MSDPLAALRADLESLRARAASEAEGIERTSDLADQRAQFLGRKGAFSQVMRVLGGLSKADRPAAGALINAAKTTVEAIFDDVRAQLEHAALQAEIAAAAVDVTLPGRVNPPGAMHPVQAVFDELVDLFADMGFDLADGPEVEQERYNFDLLNMPAEHPARDMQDTFYLEGGLLLRTQTSPVQARVMEKQDPPVRIIAPGKVFRRDDDPTHSPTFHQIEGLWIDHDVTMADLKGVLTAFLHRLFGADRRVRFRPSFFPFTEPSVEVDVWNEGKGVWMEVLGAGMVHPKVLRNVGYDPDVVQGFAFGLGVDRLAMARYGVDEIKHLFENDQRFLEQFR